MLDPASVRVLARAGLLDAVRPDRLLGITFALARWGVSPAAAIGAAAARPPDRAALIDDSGILSWRQVDRRTARMAAELRGRGVRAGEAVGLLARNGRGFVQAVGALSKCGADVLYLGTGLAAGPLAQVLERESVRFCVYDEQFDDVLTQAGDLLGPAFARPAGISTDELAAPWLADGRPASDADDSRGFGVAVGRRLSGDRLAAGAAGVGGTGRRARHIILTSGTTGPPKGAARSGGHLRDLVAVLSALPLRAAETTVIAAPLYHAWGFGHLRLAMLLGSTCVLRERFDAEQVLTDIERHRASALVVVPAMLEQLLAADPARFELSCLRLIASSGSALPGDLAARTQAAFGPVRHNLYGSTEVAYAAVATPADLAADPRTAGRPPQGVRLQILDEHGQVLPAGAMGRIFIGGGLAFAGYTDGSDKDRVAGLVATGDVGLLDAQGRLTVLGRNDDMVVVGGENVFTGQVENVLLAHADVLDAAVVDEPDPIYGVRLVAHVVLARPVLERALQDWVRDQHSRAAVPRAVRVHDQIARSATGKVLKRELRSCG